MTGMLYSDLLYRFLPLWLLPDRAETLERSWEEAWEARGANAPAPSPGTIREPFLALAPKDGEPWRPILIVQGASESGGRRALTSGVTFNCKQIDADDFLDGVGHDVAASTAILNGARFPWVSPAGTFSYRRCGVDKDVLGRRPRSRRRLFRQRRRRDFARDGAGLARPARWRGLARQSEHCVRP